MSSVFTTEYVPNVAIQAIGRGAADPATFKPVDTTDTLKGGYIVFADPLITGSHAATGFRKATPLNIFNTAMIVLDKNDKDITNEESFVGIVCDKRVSGVPVWTDANVTAGQILGPQPGTYFARPGVLFSDGWYLVALESVDRSTTAGVVNCAIVPTPNRLQLLKNQLAWEDDFRHFTTAHEGWVAIAASGTVAGTTAGAIGSLGGALLLTPNTADNASALIHGQLVGGGFACVTGKPWMFEIRMSASVDTLTGYFAGLLDAAQTVAEALPVAADGTLTANDLAAFHKAEGGSLWSGKSYGASAAGGPTPTAAFAINTAYDLLCMWDGKSALNWWVNGVSLGSETGTTKIPAATVAMVPVIQVKNGSATPGVATLSHFRAVQVK
jgi:hypothetical protein